MKKEKNRAKLIRAVQSMALVAIACAGCARDSDQYQLIERLAQRPDNPIAVFRAQPISRRFSESISDSVSMAKIYGEVFRELHTGYQVLSDDVYDNSRGSKGQIIKIGSDNHIVEADFSFTLDQGTWQLDNVIVTWLDGRKTRFF